MSSFCDFTVYLFILFSMPKVYRSIKILQVHYSFVTLTLTDFSTVLLFD